MDNVFGMTFQPEKKKHVYNTNSKQISQSFYKEPLKVSISTMENGLLLSWSLFLIPSLLLPLGCDLIQLFLLVL